MQRGEGRGLGQGPFAALAASQTARWRSSVLLKIGGCFKTFTTPIREPLAVWTAETPFALRRKWAGQNKTGTTPAAAGIEKINFCFSAPCDAPA